MKTIKNTKTETVTLMISSDVIEQCDTKAILLFALYQQPSGGFSLEEMESRLRIIDTIKNSEDEIQLEDFDAKKLKQVVINARWPAINKELFEVIERVQNL